MKPIGIIATRDDFLYVTDYNNHVLLIFDLTGGLLKVIGEFGKENGKFEYPRGIASDSSGNIFIADYNNSRVEKFDKEGTFLKEIKVMIDKKLYSPRSLAVTDKGEIWVVISQQNFIAKIDETGKVLKKFGKLGNGGVDFFNEPRYIALDMMQNLYITDYNNNRVAIFNPEGEYFGEFGVKGAKPGEFDAPEGIWVDYNGNLLIVDAKNFRVQEFGAPQLTAHKYLALHFEKCSLKKETFQELCKILEIAPQEPGVREKLRQLGITLVNELIASGNLKDCGEVYKQLSIVFMNDAEIMELGKKITPSAVVQKKERKPEASRKTTPDKASSNFFTTAAIVVIVIAIVALVLVVSRKSQRNARKARRKKLVEDELEEEDLSRIISDKEEGNSDDSVSKS
ncbi:MAG: NHL repeat-containing protein [Candidatus Wallbacteria bacterium]|nr:NHL repeat-containing protein [Candidatus Wallbacteria bacterium]